MKKITINHNNPRNINRINNRNINILFEFAYNMQVG